MVHVGVCRVSFKKTLRLTFLLKTELSYSQQSEPAWKQFRFGYRIAQEKLPAFEACRGLAKRKTTYSVQVASSHGKKRLSIIIDPQDTHQSLPKFRALSRHSWVPPCRGTASDPRNGGKRLLVPQSGGKRDPPTLGQTRKVRHGLDEGKMTGKVWETPSRRAKVTGKARGLSGPRPVNGGEIPGMAGASGEAMTPGSPRIGRLRRPTARGSGISGWPKVRSPHLNRSIHLDHMLIQPWSWRVPW